MVVGRGDGAATATRWGKWNMDAEAAVKEGKVEWSGGHSEAGWPPGAMF